MGRNGAVKGGDVGHPRSSILHSVARAVFGPRQENPARRTDLSHKRPQPREVHPSGPCVLVVDDQRAIRRALCMLLKTEGYQAIDAESVTQARERLSESEFDLVLLDIDMPGEQGTELLPELPTLAPSAVPIMITGNDDAESAVSALKQGAYDYICKPFTNEQVFDAIDQALTHRDEALNDRRNRDELHGLVSERTEDLHRALGRLEDAQTAIQRVACSLAEIRDAETGAHLRRIAVYARELARNLPEHVRRLHGIDQAYIDALFEAAPLHDIGKVGIPDDILLKPGPLTDGERQVIMRHAEIGRSILRAASKASGAERLPLIEMGMDICAAHHERFDGEGYPSGTGGDEIPLSARIVAVADVYDALATPRPYRLEGLPHDEVYNMILAEGGRAFDPDVVQAFLDAAPTMEAISKGALEEFSEPLTPVTDPGIALDPEPLPDDDSWDDRPFIDTARDLGLIS